MKCPICTTEFNPEPGQKRVRWAVSWCDGNDGLLCPPCMAAAEKIGKGVEDQYGLPPLGVCAFKSDIAKESANVSEEDWKEHRKSESWKKWVTENHPEWL